MNKQKKTIILLILVLLIIPAFHLFGKTNRIVMIVAHNGYYEPELIIPKKIFEKAGFNVVIASGALSEAKGYDVTKIGSDIRIKPDLVLKDINISEYDAVVFVGGAGIKEYVDDPAVHNIAANALKEGKVLASICLAGKILASAGLLKGRNAVSSDNQFLEKYGARIINKKVVVDGNIITGSGPEAAEEFAGEIVRVLAEKK